MALEKERQLVNAEETYAKKLEELEVTYSRARDQEVSAVKMECELNKLREIEALRQSFDKERQVWYRDKEEWTIWKAAAQGEKDELLLQVAELKRERPSVSEEGSGGEHSSSSGSEEDGTTVPGSRGAEGGGEEVASSETALSSKGDTTTTSSLPITTSVHNYAHVLDYYHVYCTNHHVRFHNYTRVRGHDHVRVLKSVTKLHKLRWWPRL